MPIAWALLLAREHSATAYLPENPKSRRDVTHPGNNTPLNARREDRASTRQDRNYRVLTTHMQMQARRHFTSLLMALEVLNQVHVWLIFFPRRRDTDSHERSL